MLFFLIFAIVGIEFFQVCSYGLYSYGPHSYGLYSYGLYSYGLYSYGLYSYGLYSYGIEFFQGQFHGCATGDLAADGEVLEFDEKVVGPEFDAARNGTARLVPVRDWLDCTGGAGAVWRGKERSFDNLVAAFCTLFEVFFCWRGCSRAGTQNDRLGESFPTARSTCLYSHRVRSYGPIQLWLGHLLRRDPAHQHGARRYCQLLPDVGRDRSRSALAGAILGHFWHTSAIADGVSIARVWACRYSK